MQNISDLYWQQIWISHTTARQLIAVSGPEINTELMIKQAFTYNMW